MMYKILDNSIVETDTGRILQTYTSVSAASRVCNDLNSGAGFQGWTPGFFCADDESQKKRR